MEVSSVACSLEPTEPLNKFEAIGYERGRGLAGFKSGEICMVDAGSSMRQDCPV